MSCSYVHAFVSDTGPGLSPKTPMPAQYSMEQATDHSHVSGYVASSQGHTVSCLVLAEGAALVSPRASEVRPLLLLPNHACRWLRNGLCPQPSLPSVSKSHHNGWSFFCWDLPFQPPKSCN